MAQALIASMARNNDAVQAMYNEYDDLIMSTFLDGLDGADDYDHYSTTMADRNKMLEMRVRRKMREAAASRRTELLTIITSLQALAVIPGSNLYVVDCGALAIHIVVHVHDAIATTRVFPEPGNKLKDGDLATLAETFFANGELWFKCVFDAVRQRNPEATHVANRGCVRSICAHPCSDHRE